MTFARYRSPKMPTETAAHLVFVFQDSSALVKQRSAAHVLASGVFNQLEQHAGPTFSQQESQFENLVKRGRVIDSTPRHSTLDGHKTRKRPICSAATEETSANILATRVTGRSCQPGHTNAQVAEEWILCSA